MRTTDLLKFATQLNKKMELIKEQEGFFPRIVQINSPEAMGSIEIVFESRKWPNKKAITYTSEGEWTRLSYWEPNQI